jgi:hypothetical protein
MATQSKAKSPQATGASNTARTVVTILLLVFLPIIGFFVMWFWAKWNVWVKALLSIVSIIWAMVLGILAVGVLVYINPQVQTISAECSQQCKVQVSESQFGSCVNACVQEKLNTSQQNSSSYE